MMIVLMRGWGEGQGGNEINGGGDEDNGEINDGDNEVIVMKMRLMVIG